MRHVIAALAGLALLAGCTSQPVDKEGNPERDVTKTDEEYDSNQVPRIHESFDRLKEAMIAGDTKTYFELYSTSFQQRMGGYEVFLRDYAASQNGWREMWRNAEVAQIAIDQQNKEVASVLIRWSTPAPKVTEFILESGSWRLHYVASR